MQSVCIEDYIPKGYENRISRSELALRTGLTDRLNRALIEEARERLVLIISADGGYFIWQDSTDDGYLNGYLRAEENRFKSQSHKIRMMRKAVRMVNPEPSKSDWPGQMSLFKEASVK